MDKSKICIYIEGGHHRNLDAKLRHAFQSIFNQLLGGNSKKIKIIASGDRGNALQDYIKACKKDQISFLLIDSEECISLKTLEERESFLENNFPNQIKQLSQECQKRIFFMIVNTESWLLTDKDNLEKKFGKNFKRDKLPQGPNFEKIDKIKIDEGFKSATKNCNKGLTKDFVFEILKDIKIEELKKHGNEIKCFFKAIIQATS